MSRLGRGSFGDGDVNKGEREKAGGWGGWGGKGEGKGSKVEQRKLGFVLIHLQVTSVPLLLLNSATKMGFCLFASITLGCIPRSEIAGL